MTIRKPRLELTWVGKEQRPKLEPRILLEDPALSYHASERQGDADIFDNKLIFGDNLLALKALEQEYTGKVKCIFIDPPYNTGSAFTHYDDGMEHSLWLTMMRDRLELLRKLLNDDGSIWITIDDNEAHYLKVLCDEVFGRANFVANIVWQKRYSRENREAIGDAHDSVLVFAHNIQAFKTIRNRIDITEEQAKIYKNPNKDPRGRWRPIPMTAQGYRPNQMYPITAPGGKMHLPPEGRCWSTIEPEFQKLLGQGRIYFGKDNNSQPNVIRYLDEVKGMVPWTWWPHDEVGHNDEAKKEIHSLFGKDSAFTTPKPERLIERILTIASNPGDLVLDSFAGSGTTGAVAHKLRRRWIMVELGDHAHTHIIPRMKKVIDGEDTGGVTASAGWKSGGGFRYYKLAPTLLLDDVWGQKVINPAYNAEMLSEAVCKLQGFTYAPSEVNFWQHGFSSERDFIYVTTQHLTNDQLSHISTLVGHKNTLLVCCSSFTMEGSGFANLTVKKIPKAVLDKADWNRDDYSLEIDVLPEAEKALVNMPMDLEEQE